MSWRKVTERDLDWVVPFLRDRIQSSMFFLSNLETAGLDGDGPYGTRMWCQDGALQGLIGLTNSGYILLQAPQATREAWRAAQGIWQTADLSGVSGAAAQVAEFLRATALDQRPKALNPDEPGYVLWLDDLKMPECANYALKPVAEDNRALAERWRAAFHGEVLGTPDGQRGAVAKADIENYVARDSHRVLMRDGAPVAMTGFNARTSDAVQIGAVYTPPELRGQGLARRAVAMHLAEARAGGVRQAILFAANAAAARAYEAIGFQRSGSMSLAMFHREEANT